MKKELADYLNGETEKLKARQKKEIEAEHTAGPWEVREFDNDKMIPTLTIIGRTARGNHIYVAKVDRRADARLIAAAPELLEALEAVLTRGSLDPSHLHKFGKEYQQAQVAIAKATGK
jgi:hypothetical protein